MDKISINNLFSSNNDFQPLDVHNLYNANEYKSKINNNVNNIDNNSNKNKKKVNFNIDRLIQLREDRKKKILVHYEKIFNTCLNKIDTANNFNKTEIIYEIPEAIYGHSDYNMGDCIAYVNEKLEELNLDTLIFGQTIYVSWLNLAENIKKNNK